MEDSKSHNDKVLTGPAAEVAVVVKNVCTFKEFLETSPPSKGSEVADLWIKKKNEYNGSLERHIFTPEILLHCSSDKCNGNRFFRFEDGSTQLYESHSTTISTFITYLCSNCQKVRKNYSLKADIISGTKEPWNKGYCIKYGEVPAFGPPTPSRLLRLFGDERETFLKGRRCESQGLGIGAFSYYRRIVENQKNAIFDEVIRVSESINAPKELVEQIRQAKSEVQFVNALSKTKDALPQSLLVNGHNPLLLLHSALSAGLHAQSDEDCLEIAHDIRVVMSEFADRLGQALSDEKELKESVNRLMGRASKRQLPNL